MAAPVVESVSSAQQDTTSTLAITKPTGTTENDLLVAIINVYGGVGQTVSDESGWTSIGNQTANQTSTYVNMKVMIKVAGGSEPSSYTFDASSSVTSMFGTIYRVSGDFYASAPIGDYTFAVDNDSETTPDFVTTTQQFRDDTLLILAAVGFTTTGTPTASGYTVSGTNPTWTERSELSRNNSWVFASASAEAESNIELTTMTLTWSATCDEHIGLLLSIPPQTAVTASPDSVPLMTAIPAQLPHVKVTASPDSVPISATFTEPTTTARTKIWTTISKL